MADEYTLTARTVFPGTSSPLERGTLTVRAGRVAAVAPHGTRTPDRDLGDAAIVPGFVNAHTHLDLTGARGRTPPTPDFVGWLRRVIAYRKERTPGQVADDVRDGIAECLRHGTTLVGDIRSDNARPIFAAHEVRGVLFHELIGLSRERANDAWEGAASYHYGRYEVSGDRPDDPEVWTLARGGLSPHAPYSVRQSLIRRVASRARAAGMPVAVHVAESRAEMQLLAERAGPFVEFLTDLGAWSPDGLVSGSDELLRILEGVSPLLLVHANYLSPDAALPKDATVVYCPRTHAAFGHPPHPFRDFLGRGVRVALGTDSLASNPDLSVLAEARFVRERYSDFDGPTLLRMATLAGAEALGWADETGSLAVGKSADFAVVELPPHDARDPHDLIFASDRPVRATVFRGELVAGNW